MVVALAALTACQPKAAPAGLAAAPRAAGPSESAYRPPPSIVSATPAAEGRLTLAGRAWPGARVRLSAPSGPPLFADAGRDGAWRLTLAATAVPRLFGLAMIDQGRAIQAEGYFAIIPHGDVVQLRAGAGALAMGGHAPGARIAAVDFDARGGTVVSGRATPRGRVEVRVDGAAAGQGGAGGDGRFTLALAAPLTLGAHRLSLIDGDHRIDVDAPLAAAAPLATGPYRAWMTSAGWRIDWLTPGGGLQTTLLLGDDKETEHGGRA